MASRIERLLCQSRYLLLLQFKHDVGDRHRVVWNANSIHAETDVEADTEDWAKLLVWLRCTVSLTSSSISTNKLMETQCAGCECGKNLVDSHVRCEA